MAEVKKKFSELDPGSVPFEGTETLAAVQGGITKRGTISGIHGAGWWDKLKAAFVDFVAPEALHANDADTVGGETSAELHNAGALIGTAPLSAIPAQLTGKNAATATSAAKLTNARTITLTGNATGSTSFDGSGNVSISVTVGYASAAGSAGYATSAGTSAACSGNAATAAKLAAARTITIAGDATGSTTFDGSANKTITLSVAKATNATNATNAGYATSAGTSAACSGNAATAAKLAAARTITIAGDATGSTTFDGSANKTITLSVAKATNATNATNVNLTTRPTSGDHYIPVYENGVNGNQRLKRGPYVIPAATNLGWKAYFYTAGLMFYPKPANSSSSGEAGQFAVGTESIGPGKTAYFLYICVANNSWRKVQLSTFS